YRMIKFGEYIMTIEGMVKGGAIALTESDLGIGELRRKISNPATPQPTRLKLLSELHSRFAFPFATLVFAILAVPMGIQNRRSGKSSGFSISIAILLV